MIQTPRQHPRRPATRRPRTLITAPHQPALEAIAEALPLVLLAAVAVTLIALVVFLSLEDFPALPDALRQLRSLLTGRSQ